MVHPQYIVLHQSEWRRLQKQGGLPEEPSNVQKIYLKELTEKSQELMQSWPDTTASKIAKLKKQQKKQHEDDVAFIMAYTNKMKQENAEGAIKKARQLIFQDSSYGRKLLSALLESRALDVREAQIKHKKKMQQKAAEIAKEPKEQGTKKSNTNYFQDNDTERKKLSKLKSLECNRINKELMLMKKEEELQIKLDEKQCIIEDEKFIKQVLEFEKKEKENIKLSEKIALEIFEADTNKFAKQKAEQKKLNEALIEVYKRKQERIKFKTQEVLKRVYQGRSDTKWSKELYEKIDRIQSEEKKRYLDFINAGINKYEKRIAKKEARDKIKGKEIINSRHLLSQSNKIAGETKSAIKYESKCAYDKQTLTMKTSGKCTKKTETKISNESISITGKKRTQKSPKSPICIEKLDEEKKEKLPFLTRRNKLIEEQKEREKEPSPWNGTKGYHVQFAQQADDVLKEIKHKYFARKVVDVRQSKKKITNIN